MADSSPNGIEEAENQSRIAKNKGKFIVEDKEDGFGGSESGYGADSDGEEDAGTGRVKLLSDVTDSGSTGKKNDARGMLRIRTKKVQLKISSNKKKMKAETEGQGIDDVKIQTRSYTKEKLYKKKQNMSSMYKGLHNQEVYKEMQNMASMLKEVHTVITKPAAPPILQVNVRGEQQGNGRGEQQGVNWREIMTPLLIFGTGIVAIGTGIVAILFAGKKFDEAGKKMGKKFDEACVGAGRKFDEGMLGMKGAIKSWEAAGCPALVTNKFAFSSKSWESGSSLVTNKLVIFNKGESSPSSGTSKRDGAGDGAEGSHNKAKVGSSSVTFKRAAGAESSHYNKGKAAENSSSGSSQKKKSESEAGSSPKKS